MSHDMSEARDRCSIELECGQIGDCDACQQAAQPVTKPVMTKAGIPLYHLGIGCALLVVAEFPSTPEGTKAANAYMATNADAGVLDASGNRIVLAHESDQGIPVSGAVRSLQCSCCGSVTSGRQWHNRDTGYGLFDILPALKSGDSYS